MPPARYDGYIDIHGNWLFDPTTSEYSSLGAFYEGLAPVKKYDEGRGEQLWGYLDSRFSMLIFYSGVFSLKEYAIID